VTGIVDKFERHPVIIIAQVRHPGPTDLALLHIVPTGSTDEKRLADPNAPALHELNGAAVATADAWLHAVRRTH